MGLNPFSQRLRVSSGCVRCVTRRAVIGSAVAARQPRSTESKFGFCWLNDMFTIRLEFSHMHMNIWNFKTSMPLCPEIYTNDHWIFGLCWSNTGRLMVQPKVRGLARA